METILKFKYDNKDYALVKDNDEFIMGYFDNDIFNSHLLEEEKKLISLVLSQITPSNNLLKLKPIVWDDKSYDMYVDLKTNFRLFSPIPESSVLSKLNLIFNNQSDILYLGSTNKEQYIQKLVKVGRKTVIILITATTILSTIPRVNAYAYEKTLPTKTLNISAQSDMIYFFQKAIQDNPNLSMEEKNMLLNNSNYIKDNQAYMDFNRLINTFSSIKGYDNVDQNKLNNGIQGSYYAKDNTFYIYTNDENKKKFTITHEMLHATQDILGHPNFNSFFVESTNVLYNNEYFGNDYSYDTSYAENIEMAKAIVEIIGSKPFMQYQNTTDESYIINALQAIIPDDEKAQTLSNDLRNYISLWKQIKIVNQPDVNNLILNAKNTKQEITQLIGEYYEAKYQRPIESDLLMQYYLNRENFNQLIATQYNVNYDSKFLNNYLTTPELKYYFNSAYTKERNGITIKIPKDIVEEYKTCSIKSALVNQLVEEVDGKYVATDERVTILPDNTVKYPTLSPSGYQEIRIDDTNRIVDTLQKNR